MVMKLQLSQCHSNAACYTKCTYGKNVTHELSAQRMTNPADLLVMVIAAHTRVRERKGGRGSRLLVVSPLQSMVLSTHGYC